MADFPTRVKTIMRLKGITTRELAESLTVSPRCVTTLLHLARKPMPRTLARYAAGLGVSVDYLEGRTNIEVDFHEVPARRGRPPVSLRRPNAS